MISITHIINPVLVKESSDLFKAQPITFETMRRAKQFVTNEIEVNLITTQYPEDHSIIPEFFTKTKDLDRSVLDFGAFEKKRKLPLLKDILDRAVDYDSEADYIIYTNVDIAVQPYFYSFIKQKIEEGHDAFVINRRTISDRYDLKTLAEAYTDYGEAHPGYDCFIFKKSLYESFEMAKVCIGTTRIGLVFITNLLMNSNLFEIFKKEHLTFHIGEDKEWQNPELNDYVGFNEQQAINVMNFFKTMNFQKFNDNELLIKYYNSLNKSIKGIELSEPAYSKPSLLKKILKIFNE